MSEILAQPTVILALMGVLAMIFGMIRIRREKMDTSVLINSALLLALAVVAGEPAEMLLPEVANSSCLAKLLTLTLFLCLGA